MNNIIKKSIAIASISAFLSVGPGATIAVSFADAAPHRPPHHDRIYKHKPHFKPMPKHRRPPHRIHRPAPPHHHKRPHRSHRSDAVGAALIGIAIGAILGSQASE